MTVTLEMAADYDYNLSSVIAFAQHWQNGKIYEMPEGGRPDNGLMYITDCENTMICGGEKIYAKSGQIVYLPKGAKYLAHFERTPNSRIGERKVTDYLLNFLASKADGESLVFSDKILVITPRDSARLRMMFEEAARKSENAAYPTALMKAAAYEIITEVSRELCTGECRSKGYSVISRALDYIGENCLHGDISVGLLSEMCHVSNATLRRMFIASVGMPPKEYISSLRIKRAIVLLENGGVSVSEAARLTGFEDPSYFSRFVKKRTGRNPTEFM